MKTTEILHAWTGILAGRKPSLSIEITKECPLRCPGCYAFDPAHLGGESELRQLSDYKGSELVKNILAIADREKPLHVSLVGGDPLVRYRELEMLLPQLDTRDVHTQLVTSAFRAIPEAWNRYTRLNVVVSIDGLQPEHDERRKPATYERILKNIAAAKKAGRTRNLAQRGSPPADRHEGDLPGGTAAPHRAGNRAGDGRVVCLLGSVYLDTGVSFGFARAGRRGTDRGRHQRPA